MEKIYTRKQLQELLHVSKSTILSLLKTGKIESFKVGNSYRITESALNDFVRHSLFYGNN